MAVWHSWIQRNVKILWLTMLNHSGPSSLLAALTDQWVLSGFSPEHVMATTKPSKPATKRELIAPNGDKRFVRRDAEGKFDESDDLGRSLAKDVKQHAKRTVPAGQGDKGDQKRKT